MHLSKSRSGELLTAVIQYWQWNSIEERTGHEAKGICCLFFRCHCFIFLIPSINPSPFFCLNPILVFIISETKSLFLSHVMFICAPTPCHFPTQSICPHPSLWPHLTLYYTHIIIIFISMHLFLLAVQYLHLLCPCCCRPSPPLPTFVLLIPLSLLFSLHSTFTTIISVLVSSHLSLSVIMFPPRCLAIIISMSYCLAPGVIISFSCVSSLILLVLGCFYSTHSPAIFITQWTNTTTSLCLSFSPIPALALSDSPPSNCSKRQTSAVWFGALRVFT